MESQNIIYSYKLRTNETKEVQLSAYSNTKLNLAIILSRLQSITITFHVLIRWLTDCWLKLKIENRLPRMVTKNATK